MTLDWWLTEAAMIMPWFMVLFQWLNHREGEALIVLQRKRIAQLEENARLRLELAAHPFGAGTGHAGQRKFPS